MQDIAEESNIKTKHLPKGLKKQGVKLPMSIKEWYLAESYLKSIIDFTCDEKNVRYAFSESLTDKSKFPAMLEINF